MTTTPSSQTLHGVGRFMRERAREERMRDVDGSVGNPTTETITMKSATYTKLAEGSKDDGQEVGARTPYMHSDSAERGSQPEICHDFEVLLVLGGGNALGAYHLGACEVLLGAGWEPRWLVGASIGAVTAAILAGNEPSQRLERLRSFWDLAQQADLAPMWSIPKAFRIVSRSVV